MVCNNSTCVHCHKVCFWWQFWAPAAVATSADATTSVTMQWALLIFLLSDDVTRTWHYSRVARSLPCPWRGHFLQRRLLSLDTSAGYCSLRWDPCIGHSSIPGRPSTCWSSAWGALLHRRRRPEAVRNQLCALGLPLGRCTLYLWVQQQQRQHQL